MHTISNKLGHFEAPRNRFLPILFAFNLVQTRFNRISIAIETLYVYCLIIVELIIF